MDDFDPCHVRAAALEVEALDGVGIHSLEHRPGHRALRGQVDELGRPRLQHAPVGGERTRRCLGAGVTPNLRHADPNGCAVSGTLQRDRPTHGRNNKIVAQVGRVRAVAAKRRDAHVHDVRVDPPYAVDVEVKRVKAAWRRRFEKKVCRGHQRFENIAIRVPDYDRTLVAVEGLE